jgi:hypothetical protein
MSKDREVSTVVVKVPDFDVVLGQVYEEAVKENLTEEEGGEATLKGTIGYVETPVGIYVLDNDGCGIIDPAMSDDATIDFDFYIATKKTIPMFPSGAFALTAKNLQKLPVKEEVLLHDFIRSFGARLEANYAECKREFETCLI